MLCATQRSLARARPGQAGLHLARRAVRTMSTAPACTWRSLGAGPQELNLDLTMPTGQSFRWRKTAGNAYTGVIGARVVQLRQLPGDVEFRVVARGADAAPDGDAAVLADYCNLRFNLSELTKDWAGRDARFREVSPYFPGARMLRQDPMECLFQFICSSNNHISRIHGMVERLCSTYGTPLTTDCPISPAPPTRTLKSQQQQQQQQQEQQQQQQGEEQAGLMSPSGTATGAARPAMAAGPSASPFAAATSAVPAAATPVPVKVRRAGEPATPRLASALAHVADEVAEARAAADEQALATPPAAKPAARAAAAAVTAEDAAGGTTAVGMSTATATAAGAGARVGKDAAGGSLGGAAGVAAARPDVDIGAAAGANVGAGEAAPGGMAEGIGAGAVGAQEEEEEEEADAGGAGLSFYAFPTLEQLEAATEEDLRAAGFGTAAAAAVQQATATAKLEQQAVCRADNGNKRRQRATAAECMQVQVVAAHRGSC